ncbi:hypothetical protein [Sphingomonas sp. NFX23]|uniref:hypothetical protein n=1 Tax=Sphingomonas sp. NFX23 TaxID=2819532 RepID=UPI003CF1FEAD
MPDLKPEYTPQPSRLLTPPIVGVPPKRDYATSVVMLGGALLNAILAILNAWAFQVTGNILIGIQATITVAALMIVFKRATIELLPLVISTGVLGAFLTIGAINHGFSVRDTNDILLIPVFLAVGVTSRYFPKRQFIYLFSMVYGSAILEVVSASGYKALFSPLSYLVSTRAWISEVVTKANMEQGLYIGSDRGGGLIFSFIANHRIGGLFLEPLSMSYFAIISAMIFITMYRANSFKLNFSILMCLLLAMVSDSRLGVGLIVVFRIIAFIPEPMWSRRIAYFVPAVILFSAYLFYSFQIANGLGDTMSRLSVTIAETNRNPLPELILGNIATDQFGDSGILRIIYYSTIAGCLIALAIFSGITAGKFKGYSYVPTMAAIYITSSALFGGAFMSIKTVALFGIYVGVTANGRFEKPDNII